MIRVPRPLAELALRLLATDPRDRPLGREVLRDLGGPAARRATPALAFSAPRLVPEFVGRRTHLAALARAFDDSFDQPTVAQVYGTSGIGKPALVRHFLEGLSESEEATVFAGRCYEHEAVPYKAFDCVMTPSPGVCVGWNTSMQPRCCRPVSKLWRGCFRSLIG